MVECVWVGLRFVVLTCFCFSFSFWEVVVAFEWLKGIFGGSGDGEPVEGGAFRESGLSDADVIAGLEASLGAPSGGVDVSRLVGCEFGLPGHVLFLFKPVEGGFVLDGVVCVGVSGRGVGGVGNGRGVVCFGQGSVLEVLGGSRVYSVEDNFSEVGRGLYGEVLSEGFLFVGLGESGGLDLLRVVESDGVDFILGDPSLVGLEVESFDGGEFVCVIAHNVRVDLSASVSVGEAVGSVGDVSPVAREYVGVEGAMVGWFCWWASADGVEWGYVLGDPRGGGSPVMDVPLGGVAGLFSGLIAGVGRVEDVGVRVAGSFRNSRFGNVEWVAPLYDDGRAYYDEAAQLYAMPVVTVLH